MCPYIHIILPSYMLMAFAGGFCALIYVFFRLERFQIEFTEFLAMSFCSIIGGAAGSKFLFALTQTGWLIDNFSVRNLLLWIPGSGFVYYGGLFGVIAVLNIYTRRDDGFRKRVFRMAVPAVPLFHAFGRTGCFLAGCCYGRKLAEPVYFMGIRLERIPVQLMEAVFELVLFAVLAVLDKKRENCDLLRVYLVSYALFRFMDEFMRGDKIRGIYFGISAAQWISLLVLAYYSAKAVKKKAEIYRA